jgi:DNA-binding MarR family transcriptional regulator
MSKVREAERGKALDQANMFLRAMYKLNSSIFRELQPALERYGIDFRLQFILQHIQGGVVHPGAISKAVRLPNSIITRHLDQLVEIGLIERSLDPEDSRRIRLTLTSKGKRVAEETLDEICELVDARLNRLDPSRRESFISAFMELSADT